MGRWDLQRGGLRADPFDVIVTINIQAGGQGTEERRLAGSGPATGDLLVW